MRPETVEHLRENWRARHRNTWREATRRRVKRPVAQWAREVRKMRGGPIAGVNTIPFSTEFCPHTVAQMEACDDPRVNIIVIWGPIRDMKTTAALCAIGRTVTDDPGGIFSVWPTKEDADKFSEDDLETMIETSLGGFFVEKKSRDSGRTKAFKKFRGGSIRIPSAGAVTAFRGSTVKVLHLPEVDALEPESIYKAFGRTTGISDAIKIMESTGTLASEAGEDGKVIWRSVIAEHYDQSDQRKWFVECAACHELSVILYPRIRADNGDAREAKWHCPRCDHGHDEAQWFHAAQNGAWYPTAGLTADELLDIRATHHKARAKRPEIAGFWRNGFNSLLPTAKGYATKLHEFLAEGEAAKSSPEKLKTWTNEIAAELWSGATQGEAPPEWKALMDRAEPYATKESIVVPSRGLVLCGGGDVHPDRIEWTWVAFGRGEEAWIVDHVVIFGEFRDHSPRGPWLKLKGELQRQFPHESGGKIGLDLGMIDAGFGWEEVFRFLQTVPAAGKLRACKGASTYPHPVVGGYGKIVTGRQGQGTLMGHFVGTDAAKDTLYSRLRLIETPDGLPDGWIHFSRRLSAEYYQQLTAEKVEIVDRRGVEERRYRKAAMVRNETTDTLVYAYASFRRRHVWDWDGIERERMGGAVKKSRVRSVEGIL